jgi:hypothetical protein
MSMRSGRVCSPSADEADRQHDHHGLDQHLHELAHRAFHRLRLVLDLLQLDAHRQLGPDGLHRAGLQLLRPGG